MKGKQLLILIVVAAVLGALLSIETNTDSRAKITTPTMLRRP